MKEALSILIFGILVYLGFATVFGDAALMGSYGTLFATYNHELFGYLSYVYLFALMHPLYKFYKKTNFDLEKYGVVISSFLFFFSLLLMQSMIIENEFRGSFASIFVDYLQPYIGVFGLWVFWVIITLVSIIIILDKNVSELFLAIKDLVKGEKQVISKNETNYEENIDRNLVKPEEVNEDFELEIDKPAYLRRNSDTKKTTNEIKVVNKPDKSNNILEIVTKIKEEKQSIIVEELEENAKLLATIETGKTEKPKNFTLPKIEFLQKNTKKIKNIDESELDEKIQYLIEKLAHFKIDGDVVRTYAGPVVSTFEFKPAANVKVSKILSLQDDLAMALSAETIRIQAPIPGKDVVGIEIPNESFDTIYLRDLLDDKLFKDSVSPLTIALGKDIVGKPFVTDLKKLPHLLIAGTTGSGKSVGINAMILSLLYKNSPDQLRLLMIDPKMLEFSIYNDIPHLLTPVITKAKQAIVALNNMVVEMERRYELMADNRTKNIENYNEKVKKTGGEHFPYIVVVIDELADLMMTSGKEVEFYRKVSSDG